MITQHDGRFFTTATLDDGRTVELEVLVEKEVKRAKDFEKSTRSAEQDFFSYYKDSNDNFEDYNNVNFGSDDNVDLFDIEQVRGRYIHYVSETGRTNIEMCKAIAKTNPEEHNPEAIDLVNMVRAERFKVKAKRQFFFSHYLRLLGESEDEIWRYIVDPALGDEVFKEINKFMEQATKRYMEAEKTAREAVADVEIVRGELEDVSKKAEEADRKAHGYHQMVDRYQEKVRDMREELDNTKPVFVHSQSRSQKEIQFMDRANARSQPITKESLTQKVIEYKPFRAVAAALGGLCFIAGCYILKPSDSKKKISTMENHVNSVINQFITTMKVTNAGKLDFTGPGPWCYSLNNSELKPFIDYLGQQAPIAGSKNDLNKPHFSLDDITYNNFLLPHFFNQNGDSLPDGQLRIKLAPYFVNGDLAQGNGGVYAWVAVEGEKPLNNAGSYGFRKLVNVKDPVLKKRIRDTASNIKQLVLTRRYLKK